MGNRSVLSHNSPIRGLNKSEVNQIYTPYVAICTGLHVIPAIPSIPGIQHVLSRKQGEDSEIQPEVYHSAQYKTRSQLTGRRVMILGTGETGMDLAYESAKAGAKEVVLCSRAG